MHVHIANILELARENSEHLLPLLLMPVVCLQAWNDQHDGEVASAGC